MLQVLATLFREHDHGLVVAAALVCFIGCVTTFRLYGRMRAGGGKVTAAWLFLIGLTAGCGIWATHFIAMLAFQPGMAVAYSAPSAIASLVAAVVAAGGAFAVAAAQRDKLNDLGAGMLLGLGIAGMHYIGMKAFHIMAQLDTEPALVGLSVLFGIAGSALALGVAGNATSLRRQMIGGGLLTVTVAAVHFTGMAAMPVICATPGALDAGLLPSAMMTFAVVTITTLIILGAIGALLIESSASESGIERARRLADAAYEGLVVVQDGLIFDGNAAFAELMGQPAEALRGRAFLGEVLTLDGVAAGGRREGWLHRDGGETIPVEAFERVLEEAGAGSGAVTVMALRDLRERRSAEARIRFLAEHDGLTSLPNRNAMQARLAGLIDRIESTGEQLAVICIDLDHFKEANDLHGHLAGDAVLVEAARRLEACVTAPSFAARLGGDEFIVVQVTKAGELPAAAGDLANTILEAFRAPLTYENHDLPLAASLGVSLWPEDGRAPDQLLANADMALYRAKESGRGAFRFFAREMDQTIRERRTLARELRQAIADEQLVLHYQPLSSVAAGEVCGFEALVRWNHPVRGLIPPGDFIPVAEESGLIVPLGEWVLRRACADAAGWTKPLRVAVNLSPLQLHQGDLPTLVHEVLIETGLSPARLELEVTESALFKDYQRALDHLRRLKGLGVRIAMDDFGTGFSSLSTLQSFPFDKIKIDKSFVENIHVHDRATVIVRAVLGLGRSLDIPVVAEGVETEEQIAFLRGEACSELQGYAIGRPAPNDAIASLMTSSAAPTKRKRTAKAA